MERLNLTLDSDTSARLARHAKRAGAPRATYARGILREALDARETLERRKKLAADYDVGPDGRFVMVKRLVSASTPAELVVLDGWNSTGKP